MSKEALKEIYQLLLTEPHTPTVCTKLERIAREALAQPEQEPVAWMEKDVLPLTHIIKAVVRREKDETYTEPLYTTPPQRQPLTDEQIRQVMRSLGWTGEGPSDIEFARAIEAAHGIKEYT